MSYDIVDALKSVAWATAFGVVGFGVTQCAAKLPDRNALLLKCIEMRGEWVPDWGSGRCVFNTSKPQQ
jgi:hypothetical protein